MEVEAVLWDVGGVLEVVDEPLWLGRWCTAKGVDPDTLDALVDPDGGVVTGAVDEAATRAGYARALHLSGTEADAFMADLWDWYCGRLDPELVAYARALRPRWRTGILSNSADGARREETARWALPDLVDDVVYSHEVGLAKPDPRVFLLACSRLGVAPGAAVLVDDVVANVEAARAAGLRAVLHTSTPTTVSVLDQLLGRR